MGYNENQVVLEAPDTEVGC